MARVAIGADDEGRRAQHGLGQRRALGERDVRREVGLGQIADDDDVATRHDVLDDVGAGLSGLTGMQRAADLAGLVGAVVVGLADERELGAAHRELVADETGGAFAIRRAASSRVGLAAHDDERQHHQARQPANDSVSHRGTLRPSNPIRTRAPRFTIPGRGRTPPRTARCPRPPPGATRSRRCSPRAVRRWASR